MKFPLGPRATALDGRRECALLLGRDCRDPCARAQRFCRAAEAAAGLPAQARDEGAYPGRTDDGMHRVLAALRPHERVME
jgi:hypothetical protein